MAATPVQPSITANITNAPTLTLTTTKTLTNSPAPVVNVFKNVNASGGGYNGVLDTGNNSIIKQIVIKVTGVINFPNEKLTIDGFDIPLLKTTVDGRFPTGGSLTNGSSYSVVQIGSVTTVTLKNLNLLTLGDTNQANALMESILYKNTDPTPTDGNRSIIMVSMTDGGVVGTSNNGYFGQNYTAFNPSLMTSTVTLDRTAPNAPVLNVAENDGVGVTNTEGQDGTSVVVSLVGTGAREGDVVTMTVKDLAPIKYTLQGLDIDSESVNLAISAATLTLLGSGSVPVNVTITDAAQNTSVVSAVNMNLVNVNSAPSGASSTVIILEDNSRTFTAGDFGFSDVVSDFFYGENSGANTLSAVIIKALPTVGTLTLNNVNVIQNQRIPAANLSDLKYTPALNGNGISYASIGFKVQDNGGTANGGSDTSTENTLTINVTPVNDAPVFVNPIPNQMAVFNTPFEYTMPANIFTDVDSPALTYLATLDNGSVLPPWLNFDAATGKFTGMAKSTAGFNVKVTASDGALNVSNMFQIDLAPMVTNVAITGATGSQNNRLNAGDVVSASVTFSESVNVTGLPQLALNIGGNTVKADYASGSGTSVLTFNYTILSGQNDTDGISIEANALSLNAGTIKDANGNHAVISIAQAMDNASYIVDNVTPLWLLSNPNDNGYLMDLAANLSLTFNEGVSKGTGTIQLYNAANTLVESFDVATSSRITGWNAKTLTIDPTANLTANTGYYVKIAPTAINDLAGNAYAGISDATMLNFTTVDATGGIVPTTATSTASSTTRLGYTLSNIGDFNGDGYDDLLIGDYAADSYYWNTYGGAAYVVYGNASGIVPNLNSGTIAASLGFRVVGGNWSQLGTSLSGAGDVNGDGYMDILVSTLPGYQYANGAFASYVMYGTSNSAAVFGSRFEMYYGGLPTSMGFKIYGPGWGNDYGPGGLFGENVSQLGDVNGDGLSDFAVTQHTPTGGQTIGTYVMYGKTGGASYYLTAAAISPNDGFLIGTVGTEISGAGDVNGDGLADIIVSSDYYNTAFVVYGNSISSSVSLSYGSGSIAGTQGFKIVGPPSNSVGYALSSAGDVNGDGLADLIVGVAANNGSVFVVYGNSTGSTVDFSSGNIAASQGYKISASSAVTNLGYSVSSAGDMNGDGLNDLILSASGSNSVYVVYGNATGTNMTLGASISPSQGFVIKGPVGTAVSSAGDVNGDGLADLLLGPAGGAIGYSIILGGTQWVTSAVNGVGKVDGTSADEAIIGSAGDDTLTGGGGVDRFFAGKGNDTIVLTVSDIANLANNTAGQSVKANVNGGNGFDTIELNGGANLDLTTISNTAAMSTDETSRIDNVERIDLSTDKAANTLKLHTKDVNDMAGMNVFRTGIASADGKVWTNVTGNALSATTTAKHQMLVDGDSNDSVSLNASNGVWRNVGTVNNGASNYTVYEDSNTASQVLVKSGVAVQNTGAPLLISSNPTDSGYMMGLGNNITLTFDQPIQQGIGTIQLWNGTTGAFVESFDVTSSALVTGWSGTTLTINPTADLAPNNNYFVKVGDAALKNAAGATFTGVNLSTTVDFTTVDAAGSIVVNNSISWISQGLGNDVAGVGDFNGDGYDDVIIGAYKESLYGSSYTQEGVVYVVYGNSTGTVPTINGTIANSQGFKLMGGEMNWLGWAVSGVGDINGDGYSDLMLASGNDLRSGVGSASYVVYGRSAMSDTTGYNQGPRIAGAYHAISGAGDVNGDGIADMVVTQYSPTTAYYAGNGAAYVLYGSTAGGGWDLRFGTLAANQGFKIASGSAASLGYSASGAGDFNGDGFADIIVSARTYGAQNQGAAYVVYGNSTGAGVSFDATNGIAASQGFRISGQVNTNLGESVSSAGDVNGDGLADVMVSSKTAGVGGSVYVLYGTGAGNGLDIDLNTSGGTIAANRGFVISNAQVGGNLGSYMASAGDVNGDGLSDMILSAPSTNNSAYIVYGNANGTSVAINSNGQIAASQGFRLTGSVGLDVSSAGDINGDGLADLVMGGGASYGVILGGTQWLSLVVDGIGAVNGTSESEALIGSTGNDTLTGGGGIDRFFAGMGNDTIVLTASDFTNLANNVTGQTAKENVNGGNGFDTIRVSGGANVDLMSISNAGAMGLEENSRIESIERIDLATDSAANKLTLAAKDVKDMASFNMIRTGSASADGNTWTNVTGSALSATTRYHQVVVDGTSADSMMLVEDLGLWSNSGTVSNGTATYTVYQNAATASQVLVKSDVLVASAVAPNLSPSPIAPFVNMGAPVLLSVNPSDNGYMMAVGNNISMTFDQAVSKGTGTIQLWNGATNALVESFDVATSSLVTGWASKTLTINPSANLAFSSSYYIKTTDSAIKNTAGKTFAGINDTTTLNFSTPASDGSVSPNPLYGAYASDYLGVSISNTGDVNGDGYDDFIVSASGTNSAYVIYGNASGLGAYVDARSIAASQGFKMTGGLSAGYTVSGAGDVNGDGYADMLVGTFYGGAYVVYGGSAMGNNVMLTDITANSGGFTIGYSGYRVVNAGGDINGDGLADFILSGYSNSYVVYGRIGRNNLDLSNGITPSDGFAVNFGQTVSSAGDVNGDGFDDLIVGYNDIKSAFVVYGNSTGNSISLNSNTIASSSGFKIATLQPNSTVGYFVSSAGDVNGDGLADVMVSDGISIHVVYGKTTSATVNIDNAGSIGAEDGFKIKITNGQLGRMVAAGDINGDGFADMLIGSPVYEAGTAYVVYGGSSIPNTVNVDSTSFTATNGFKITGEIYYSKFANTVSSAGDINGDGLGDLIFGVYSHNTSYQGGYKILLGGTQWLTDAINLTGTTAAEAVLGTTGDDTLTGGGGVDRFFAGMGNDTIVLTASDFTNLANNVTGQTAKENVNGGNGFDTIRVSGGANVDLMSISNAGAMGLEENSRIESIERIDLATDSAANKLTLAAKDVKDMASFNMIRTGSASADGNTWINVTGSALSATTRYHQVVVDGTSADSMMLVEDLGLWSNSGTVSNGTATYTVYQNAATASQVLVKSDVLVASAVAPNPIPNPNPNPNPSPSPSPSPVAPVVNMGAPVLLSGNPSDNGYMMAVGNNISMTFDQAVSKGTGTIQLWNGATNALVESFDVATSSLVTGWASKTLTINPSANLAFSSSYYIKTTDSAIKNTAGKTFAGISDATTYNFTTAASDGSISAGVTYTGLVGSYVGISVSSAGDVNADGFDDYIIGTYANKAYVVYGNASGTGASVPNGNIASSLGFQIIGTGALGYKVSGAGDVNGDGFADVIVGTNASIGAAYVVYGGSNITKSVNVTATSFSPANGFKITGVDSYMGMDVSSAGDINGDGLADLIVGAQGYNAATETEGAAFIVYGATNNTGVDLSNGTIPVTNGFRVTGQDYVYFASSISSAGDVNGDGLADLVIGGFDTNIYVVYGKAKTMDINLSSTIIAATNGFRIVTNQLDTTIGNTVSSAGDVNGDGLGDLVMSGENAYVVYGNSTGRTVTIDVNGVIAASNGFRIAGLSNYAVSSAGDVNGDGLADVLVGKNSTNGAAYVVYGNASGTTVTVDANGNIPASSGFKITGETSGSMGKVFSAAGDINGDGLGDLLIGSLNENGAYNVVLGGTQWLTSAVSLTGTAGNEAVMGTVSNDTLIGGGGVDRFFAGMGNDTIVLTASDITNLASNTAGQTVKENVSGGNGFDTIRLSGGAALDLTTISNVGAMGLEENSRIESIERIDMTTDTAVNKLTLMARDVKDMAGFDAIRTGSVSDDGNTWTNVTGSALSAITKYHQVVVDGTSADGVTLAADLGFWANAGTASNGTTTYTIYQNTGTNSQVLVSSDVVVTNNDATPDVVLTGLVI